MAKRKPTQERQAPKTPEAALSELSGIVKRMENASKARLMEAAEKLRPSTTTMVALVAGAALTAGILIWTSRRRQAVAAPEDTAPVTAEQQTEHSPMTPALSRALQDLLATGISAGIKAWTDHQQQRSGEEAGRQHSPEA
jgi:hypothetical protein